MIDFELPKELVAQEPVQPRDAARLLVYDRKSQQITDSTFSELLTFLPNPTVVVANNSKVEHCRMLFDDGKREIFVLEKANDKTVRALVRPGKQFRLGSVVQLTESVKAEVTAVDTDGIRTIVFSETLEHPDLLAAQHVPLPPYITQNDELAQEYQTVYAKPLGSKAAPTAGLHFTDDLKKRVQAERDWAEVTLHVGLGTFAPLTEEQLSKGKLHEEWYEISDDVDKKLLTSAHVTAVGTTSVRTIESRMRSGLKKDATDILIMPGYSFQRVDSLITNFHLPGTSLLLLVEAFVGSESEMQRIYDHAVQQKYRFYSFGDAMLIV